MPNAVIVIEPAPYTYHPFLSECAREVLQDFGFCCKIMNLSTGKADHIYYHEIAKYHPELLVSFDMAGFCLTNETEEASYNSLGCIMAHLIIAPLQDFERYFSKQLNFSMFFYSAGEEAIHALCERCPDIPNLRLMPALALEGTAAARAANRSALQALFRELLQETKC